MLREVEALSDTDAQRFVNDTNFAITKKQFVLARSAQRFHEKPRHR
jgi:hypothetical protein